MKLDLDTAANVLDAYLPVPARQDGWLTQEELDYELYRGPKPSPTLFPRTGVLRLCDAQGAVLGESNMYASVVASEAGLHITVDDITIDTTGTAAEAVGVAADGTEVLRLAVRTPDEEPAPAELVLNTRALLSWSTVKFGSFVIGAK